MPLHNDRDSHEHVRLLEPSETEATNNKKDTAPKTSIECFLRNLVDPLSHGDSITGYPTPTTASSWFPRNEVVISRPIDLSGYSHSDRPKPSGFATPITPMPIRAPALPVGWSNSSASACTTTARPRTGAFDPPMVRLSKVRS